MQQAVAVKVGRYRLVRLNEDNLQLEKRVTLSRGKRAGEKDWVFVGYYTSVAAGVSGIALRAQHDVVGKTNLKQWLRDYEHVLKTFVAEMQGKPAPAKPKAKPKKRVRLSLDG